MSSPSGSPPAPVVRHVEVLNEAGLHARPAAILAQRTQAFDAQVTLVLVHAPADLGVATGTRVDASSVMDILFLAAPQGTRIDVEAEGADAEAAADEIARLFEERFGIPS